MHIIKIYSFGQNTIFSFAGGRTLHLYVLKQINFIHFTCQSDKKITFDKKTHFGKIRC